MIDVKVSIPNESNEVNFNNFLNPKDKRLSEVNFHINKQIFLGQKEFGPFSH